MAFSNRMTSLINKIERRLGTSQLNLPEYLQKDKWADGPIRDSVESFSRFFPHKFTYLVNPKEDMKGDYCIIDEDKIGKDINILGCKDIDFEKFSKTYNYAANNYTYNLGDQYGMDDIGQMQMRADHTSLFNNGIYIDWEPPNKVRITSVGGINILRTTMIPIILLIEHPMNLNTISPTIMETFEGLALCDVSIFLFNELKYYDQLESVYGNIDLKMDELSNQASKREDILIKLDEAHNTAANDNMPMIVTN